MTTTPAARREQLDDALAASRAAREAAERELNRSIAIRSRAGEALERTARRPGIDEGERARLRAEYAAADRTVAEHRAAVDRAREFERAAGIVAQAFQTDALETDTVTSRALADALLDLVASGRRSATRGRAALVSARRAAPAARLRGTRPRSA